MTKSESISNEDPCYQDRLQTRENMARLSEKITHIHEKMDEFHQDFKEFIKSAEQKYARKDEVNKMNSKINYVIFTLISSLIASIGYLLSMFIK